MLLMISISGNYINKKSMYDAIYRNHNGKFISQQWAVGSVALSMYTHF